MKPFCEKNSTVAATWSAPRSIGEAELTRNAPGSPDAEGAPGGSIVAPGLGVPGGPVGPWTGVSVGDGEAPGIAGDDSGKGDAAGDAAGVAIGVGVASSESCANARPGIAAASKSTKTGPRIEP